jgi:predicted dehydrogenase
MRVAIIGAGFGARVVAGVFEETGAEVVDVVSPRDPAAVRAAVAAPVDLVSVHSPPFLHVEHVSWAIDAGHDVLCDKPFGRSAADAAAMLALAEGAGVLHFVNFEFRQDPTRAALRQVVRDGQIGDPVHLHWTAFNSGSRRPLRNHGWLFERDTGGGWIGAFGSHAIDTIRGIMGEIERADATLRTDIRERPDADGVMHPCTAEDAFTARFQVAGGATAVLDTAFSAPVNLSPRITVFGTEGVAELVGARELTVRRPGEAPIVEAFAPFEGDPHLPAMRPWAALVRDAVETRRQITPSFADGVACARVMDLLRA